MLSIIIPTYNEEKYLPILLQSIKEQAFNEKFEIIVADNNSTDRTVEIALSFGATVTRGGLPGQGRNFGALSAKGKYLLFLDADVQLTNRFFLIDCLDEFEEYNYGCATCAVTPLSSLKRDQFGHAVYNLVMKFCANFSPVAPGFCIWVKKDVHRTIYGFDEEIKLAEDSDYVQRAKKINSFGILQSYKVPVSVRRLDRDGRFNVAIKYILAGIHMMVLGNIKSDIFKYTFGH